MRTQFRDPFSGLSHLFTAAAAVFGSGWLLYAARGDLGKQAALLLYGLTLILMFASSAAYHLVKASSPVVLWLRKLDHSAIYLLIAGTYTPICMYFFSGFWRWGLLAIVWAMALVGVGVKLFVINAPRWVTAGIYLVMGWLSILGIGEMFRAMPGGALAWLIAGGATFTLGAIIYILKKPDPLPGVFGFHEIWHIFVVLGCLCHYILVAVYVAPMAAYTF